MQAAIESTTTQPPKFLTCAREHGDSAPPANLTALLPLRTWWRIRFVFSGGNLVVAQVAQLHRTEPRLFWVYVAQAVLGVRRSALVKPSLMRRVRIIRNCL